ncbi:MAG: hypothetical protein E7491_07710 [Ruminococcaceae bacterium]|nr:hypothetical protein [Oscillospiraceae bacterium]
MKKLVAIILSLLFCVTLTCCGTEDVLAGLPEIPRDERIFYNGTRVEKGEGLDEARPVKACPYDEKPTREQAEKDGAYIIYKNTPDYNNIETIVKNTSAMERFVRNVNRGIDDSLLVFYITRDKNGKESTWAEFLYYANGELKTVYGFGKKYRESVYSDDDEVNILIYEGPPYLGMIGQERGLFVPMEYVPIGASVTPYIHKYNPYKFIELTENALLYKEGVTEKFVNVAGIYEGNGGETRFYEKYPFEEAFPTANQVFDLGGMVVFDNDFATKAYNTAALERFRESLKNNVPDTLIVYTDNGDIYTVMYSYTGDSMIISTDRRSDGRGDVFTTEIFGKNIKLVRYLNYPYYIEVEATETASEKKTFERRYISIRYKAIDDKSGEVEDLENATVTKIMPIYYVTEHIVPESEAKNYR